MGPCIPTEEVVSATPSRHNVEPKGDGEILFHACFTEPTDEDLTAENPKKHAQSKLEKHKFPSWMRKHQLVQRQEPVCPRINQKITILAKDTALTGWVIVRVIVASKKKKALFSF